MQLFYQQPIASNRQAANTINLSITRQTTQIQTTRFHHRLACVEFKTKFNLGINVIVHTMQNDSEFQKQHNSDLEFTCCFKISIKNRMVIFEFTNNNNGQSSFKIYLNILSLNKKDISVRRHYLVLF